MAKYAKIRDKTGWSYQITDEDVLWAARMVEGEGGDPGKDPAAVLWAMTQLLSPAAQQEKYGRVAFASFADLIRAYSQPINPAWDAASDPKCQEHPSRCSPEALRRRERFQTMRFGQTRPTTQAAVLRWAHGLLRNPVPRAVEFADPAVTAGFVRRHPGSAYVARYGNHYVATAGSRTWPPGFVTVGLSSYVWWIGGTAAALLVVGVGLRFAHDRGALRKLPRFPRLTK